MIGQGSLPVSIVYSPKQRKQKSLVALKANKIAYKKEVGRKWG
jgi:hypothetical protein